MLTDVSRKKTAIHFVLMMLGSIVPYICHQRACKEAIVMMSVLIFQSIGYLTVATEMEKSTHSDKLFIEMASVCCLPLLRRVVAP